MSTQKVGDKIIIDGNPQRFGTLRFKGAVKFAEGDWAGVELDLPNGKNDGSVAGERYFECRPQHGVFVPIHKIKASRLSMQQHHRTESRESIASITSNRSTTKAAATSIPANRQSRILPTSAGKKSTSSHGAASPSSVPVPQRSSTAGGVHAAGDSNLASVNYKMLRDDIENKSQLIEQLVADNKSKDATANQIGAELEQMRAINVSLQQQRELLEQEKQTLETKLEESKSAREELEFQIEEKEIDKSAIEAKHSEIESKLEGVSSELTAERNKLEEVNSKHAELTASLEKERARAVESEESAHKFAQETQELRGHVTRMETALEEARLKLEESPLKTELQDVTSRLREEQEKLCKALEELSSARIRLTSLETERHNLGVQLESASGEKDRLTAELSAQRTQHSEMSGQSEAQRAKLECMERTLAEEEEKKRTLTNQIGRMEREFAESLRSGGESGRQIETLTVQLQDKSTALESLEAVQDQLRRQLLDAETKRAEALADKERELEHTKHDTERKLAEMQSQLDIEKQKTATEASRLTETRAQFEERREREEAQHRESILEMQRKLEQNAAEMQSAREELDRVKQERMTQLAVETERRTELERVRSELAEKSEERAALESQLVEVRAETQRIEGAMRDTQLELERMGERLEAAGAEAETAHKARVEAETKAAEANQSLETARATLADRQSECGAMRQRITELETEAEARQSDLRAEKELEQLNQTLNNLQLRLKEEKERAESVKSANETLLVELEEKKRAALESEQIHRTNQTLVAELQQCKARLDAFEQSETLVNQRQSESSAQLKALHAQLEQLKLEKKKLTDELSLAESNLAGERAASGERLRDAQSELERLEREIASAANQDATNQQQQPQKKDRENKIENLEQTVSMLNGIIAHMNSKNTELEKQIKLLLEQRIAMRMDLLRCEEAAANGAVASSSHGNGTGNGATSGEESAAVTAVQESHKWKTWTDKEPISWMSSARFYCDYCEEFDEHDTIDCEKRKAMLEEAAQHKTIRNYPDQKEKYCEICKTNDHTTDDCDYLTY